MKNLKIPQRKPKLIATILHKAGTQFLKNGFNGEEWETFTKNRREPMNGWGVGFVNEGMGNYQSLFT